MLRVGLTGGVGSGKSAVVEMLRVLGAPVSQSDEVGRAMMQPDGALFEPIVRHFGPEMVAGDGTLDRVALARAAFGGGRLEELNSLVHPAVIAAQSAWFDSIAQSDPAAVAFVESALLFETRHAPRPGSATPWRTRFDRIVVVTAPVELRRARFVERLRGRANPEELALDFDRRVAAQWPDADRVALADFVLHNDGSLDQLRIAVETLYRSLHDEAADAASEAM